MKQKFTLWSVRIPLATTLCFTALLFVGAYFSYDPFVGPFVYNERPAPDFFSRVLLLWKWGAASCYQGIGLTSLFLAATFALLGIRIGLKGEAPPLKVTVLFLVLFVFTTALALEIAFPKQNVSGLLGLLSFYLLYTLIPVGENSQTGAVALFFPLTISCLIFLYFGGKNIWKQLFVTLFSRFSFQNPLKSQRPPPASRKKIPLTPPLSLLKKPQPQNTEAHQTEVRNRIQPLKKALSDFGIKGEIIDFSIGPVVAVYNFFPAPGIKASRIISLADDIARSIGALSCRIAPIPGKQSLGIEVPLQKRQPVLIRSLIQDPAFTKVHHDTLTLAMGQTIDGKPFYDNLEDMPHLLIAGTTGAGKSVGLNAMLISILYNRTPQQCRFVMIDPKILELSLYNDIPHLLTPVVTDPKHALSALKWLVNEMDQRYQKIADLGVRDISGYNQKVSHATKTGKMSTLSSFQRTPLTPLPRIVLVIDEFADLMIIARKDVEDCIQRLAQKARACGMHMILATQRPSVDVITGTIKANLPTRMTFKVASKTDSRVVMGQSGAEQLLGHGDMLYIPSASEIIRLHGAYVSDTEVTAVAKFCKAQQKPDYITIPSTPSQYPSALPQEEDPLYQQAVDCILQQKRCSTSLLQRRFNIGYNRAARMVDTMEKNQVVSSPDHTGKRSILL